MTTSTPDPSGKGPQKRSTTYGDLEALMATAMREWSSDAVIQGAIKRFSESGKALGDLQKAKDEKESPEVRSAAALKFTTDVAHSSEERAQESEKRAKINLRVAIASAAIAAMALFGALPQGIAAIPEAWAVLTGGWPPAPPSPPASP